MSAIKEHYHDQIEAAMSRRPKARPILFTADMVRAILEGRKTQTRRIIKPQPQKIDGGWKFGKKYHYHAFGAATPATDVLYPYECPYGCPGDYLWVKEYFWRNRNDHNDIIFEKPEPKYKSYWQGIAGRFMPRTASRILLEITDIRAERLQDITEEDANKEGAELLYKTDDGFYKPEPEIVLAVGHFGEYKLG